MGLQLGGVRSARLDDLYAALLVPARLDLTARANVVMQRMDHFEPQKWMGAVSATNMKP